MCCEFSCSQFSFSDAELSLPSSSFCSSSTAVGLFLTGATAPPLTGAGMLGLGGMPMPAGRLCNNHFIVLQRTHGLCEPVSLVEKMGSQRRKGQKSVMFVSGE